MKKLLPIIVLITLSCNLHGQNPPYQVGERVEYIIHYGLINGGVASLELKKDTFAGKEYLHSVFIAKTTGIADALFKVRDSYESYFDAKSELPVKSIRNIQEGRYKKYNLVLFSKPHRLAQNPWRIPLEPAPEKDFPQDCKHKAPQQY